DIPPPDWADQIRQRVFFDPAKNPKTGQPIPGVDRSLRAYFHTVSSGLADLDVVVQLPEAVIGKGPGGTDVAPDVLDATKGNLLRANGFDGAAIVMLGVPGGGSTAQLSNFAWSRFCISDNLGNWVGEIMHQTNLCDLPDLSPEVFRPTPIWVLLSRRLAISPLIPVPGRNGPSDGSIRRLFDRTLGALLITPCTQSPSFNRPRPEEWPPCKLVSKCRISWSKRACVPTNSISIFPAKALSSTKSKQQIHSGMRRMTPLPLRCSRKLH